MCSAGAGVAIVDGFTRQLGLAGLGWRPFVPTILLPVTLMSQGNHLLSRHANGLVSSIEKVLQAWTRSMRKSRR